MTRMLGSSRSSIVASRRVRRRQDDNRASRSPDPSLRNHRNRQRELAFQTPRVSATPACPGGQTGTSHARRSVAREGTARRARDPPVRYRDKPVPRPVRGPFCMPIRGPDCLPFDIAMTVASICPSRSAKATMVRCHCDCAGPNAKQRKVITLGRLSGVGSLSQSSSLPTRPAR